MVLSMMLTLFAGCSNPAAPADPAPEPESISDPEPVPEPEPEPATVEGVVKEASPSKLIVTLADGTDLALDTTGIADMQVNLGDEVKVEYTGVPGSAVAGKVDVTKAAPVSKTVTGEVKELTSSMLLLAMEDETEIILNIKDIEGLEVKVGDNVTVEYINDGDGAVASSVEVNKPDPSEDSSSDAGASTGSQSQASAPAASSGTPTSSNGASSGSAPAPKQDSSSGSSKFNGGSDPNDMGAALFDWLENAGFTEVEEGSEDDTEKPAESQTEPTPSEDTGDVYEAIRLINAERAKAGLAELEIDSGLMDAAAVRAVEITDVRGHTRPNGTSAVTAADEAGVEYSGWVENCFSAQNILTAKAAVDGWMDSAGHKANILNGDITKIGVGFHRASGANYKYGWVMLSVW